MTNPGEAIGVCVRSPIPPATAPLPLAVGGAYAAGERLP